MMLVTAMLILAIVTAFQAQAQTLHGYNSSRLMDQITDSEGLILLSGRVAAIKAIPEAERAVLRRPGGKVSTKYDNDCYSYDCKGSKRYGGKNAVNLFIELCKELGCKVSILGQRPACALFDFPIATGKNPSQSSAFYSIIILVNVHVIISQFGYSNFPTNTPFHSEGNSMPHPKPTLRPRFAGVQFCFYKALAPMEHLGFRPQFP
jgi:hypothetical protein